MGPLAGLRVIEMSHIMSGPTCGMLLADMGAAVIKVEKILGGDDTRRFTPPEINAEPAAFMMMNRNISRMRSSMSAFARSRGD